MEGPLDQKTIFNMHFHLAVVGSRTFTDYELLSATLSKVKTPIHRIVSGGARGADSLAERYAEDNDIPVFICVPDWKAHGNKAPLLRNQTIVNLADALIAFWDGESRGTKHTLNLARKRDIPVHIIRF